MAEHSLPKPVIDKQKLIMFLLVDAVNDDTRGLYELRYDQSVPYEIVAGEIKHGEVSEVLKNLVADGYFALELVTEPAWEIVEEIEPTKAGRILDDPANWGFLDNDRAYTVTTKDGSRTIQLEKVLYDELRSQGLELKFPI